MFVKTLFEDLPLFIEFSLFQSVVGADLMEGGM